jgi:hypothetical protein
VKTYRLEREQWVPGALPFGPLGLVAHALAVRAALAAIFDYRFDRIREILGSREVAGGND